MTDEKNECTTIIRDMRFKIHALEETETRLSVELGLMKKNLRNSSKCHDTSQVCYKCKGKVDASESTFGDILIKLKEENGKLKNGKSS